MNKKEFENGLKTYWGKVPFHVVYRENGVVIYARFFEGENYEEIMKEILNDEEFALMVISGNPKRIANLEGFSSKFQNNKTFIKKALKWNYKALAYADEKYGRNKVLMRSLIKRSYGKAFEYVPDSAKHDAEFISYVIDSTYGGLNFYYKDSNEGQAAAKKVYSLLPPDMLINKKVILTFLPFFIPAHIDESLLNDEDFMIQAIYANDKMLNLIPSKFRGNKDFFLEVGNITFSRRFYQNKYVLELLEDKDFVIKLITFEDYVYAIPKRLFKDKDIVLTAAKYTDKVFEYVPASIRNDKSVMMEAVKQDGHAVQYIGKKLADDDYFIYELIKIHPFSIRYASARLRDDFDMVMEAIKRTSTDKNEYAFSYLKFVSDRLKDDKDIITEAMKRDKGMTGEAYSHASDRLKKDPDILALKNFL